MAYKRAPEIILRTDWGVEEYSNTIEQLSQ